MQYGPSGGGLWHQRHILGVVSESTMTMKESRRVMILTPDGDVYVENASEKSRAKTEQCLWNFLGAPRCPSLREWSLVVARLQGIPPERRPP